MEWKVYARMTDSLRGGLRQRKQVPLGLADAWMTDSLHGGSLILLGNIEKTPRKLQFVKKST
jgi:hypothetical protein